MSEISAQKLLLKLRDRLYTSLMVGPALDCRPHSSRQRIDLAEVARLGDLLPSGILNELLGEKQTAKVNLKSEPNPVNQDSRGIELEDPSKIILRKLSLISDDARNYENDTGSNALFVGFPILSLPKGSLVGVDRRIFAPIAFIPISMTLKLAGSRSIQLSCAEEGVDRVIPNAALMSWLEKISGCKSNVLFADEDGTDPWREILDLSRFVALALDLKDLPSSPCEITVSKVPPANAEENFGLFWAAVVGLFPVSNQGILQDLNAMCQGEALQGPVLNFLSANPNSEDKGSRRENVTWRAEQESHITDCDPCQGYAVTEASHSPCLVIHGPPGTGKSQTIANIISDHLARGERVLFVCEKRAALDVVLHRLGSAGISELCAVVHDPLRDRGQFCLSVKTQLDQLPQVSAQHHAKARLAEVNKQINIAYQCLKSYHDAVTRPCEFGNTISDLINTWLMFPESELTEQMGLISGIDLNQLSQLKAEFLAALHAAGEGNYQNSPWAAAAGPNLEHFVLKSPRQWKASVAELRELAKGCEAFMQESDFGFDHVADLDKQAYAREEFFRRLLPICTPSNLSFLTQWAQRSPIELSQAKNVLDPIKSEAIILAQATVELGFDHIVSQRSVASDREDLDALRNYAQIQSKWYRALYVDKVRKATRVARLFGLGLSKTEVKRLIDYFENRLRRNMLESLCIRVLGETDLQNLSEKDFGRRLLEIIASVELLNFFHDNEVLNSCTAILTNICHEGIERLKRNLAKSSAAAAALKAFRGAVLKLNIFDHSWEAAMYQKLVSCDDVSADLRDLENSLADLEPVLKVKEVIKSLVPDAAKALLIAIASEVDATSSWEAFSKGVYAALIEERLSKDRSLKNFDANRLVQSYQLLKDLRLEKIALVRESIKARWIHAQRVRLLDQGLKRVNDLGADLARRLVSKGKNALRLRQIIAMGQRVPGGDPLLDLRPVWLASPETVAQIFPRQELFDVLIVDEASQCRLEESLPLLLRAKRVVIAGDHRQLPPTRFFESALKSTTTDDISSEQGLFESVQSDTEDLLSSALNLGVNQSYLDVHYRSHSSYLIEFSNRHFYESRLQPLPPSPSTPLVMAPIDLIHANGIYAKGVNIDEIRVIIKILKDLLAQANPPSIGIVCFNMSQREKIIDALGREAEGDKAFSDALNISRNRRSAGSFEGLFVKNLENVQGDERDHIIISTTYGPDANGKFYRRFGPLGLSGGGRRLNVLVTRAREKIHLVSSIPREVYRSIPPIPKGEFPSGAWLLFSYLNFAEQLGTIFHEQASATVLSMGSPERPQIVERQTRSGSPLARGLAPRAANYLGSHVDVYSGNDGFCVDLALHHRSLPGHVLSGVFIDSSRYENAPDPVLWDVCRAEILERQGWSLQRIFSPQLYRNYNKVLDNLRRDIEAKECALQ